MKRPVPIISTMLVLAAVATMIALGVWQLGRKAEKEALIARYESALALSSEAPWPTNEEDTERSLYRVATVDCLRVVDQRTTAGRNPAGVAGLAHTARCALAAGGEAEVVIGWSADPRQSAWRGGVVTGVVAPGPRLVALNPAAGLQPLARPDPRDLPNNHLAYAGQWFLFALTALVIYILALRRRSRR